MVASWVVGARQSASPPTVPRLPPQARVGTDDAVANVRTDVDLLDAAHILSDAEGGQPVVPNGLSLCKIHHAAYDRGILGVRRDYVVEVRADMLIEVDGPMLKHGIQDVHGWTLEMPKRVSERPDQDLLEQRWQVFSRR